MGARHTIRSGAKTRDTGMRRSLRHDLVTAAIAMFVFTLLLGIVYPLAIEGVSQLAFPGNANGQRLYSHRRVVGSKLIGQPFMVPSSRGGKHGKPQEEAGLPVLEADPRYFQTRPSGTEGGPDNAAASAFSNRGPNSKLTKEADEERIEEYLRLNRPYDRSLTVAKIPVDAVSTSASGFDPQISEANARIQAHRVAALRQMPLGMVDSLIVKYTSARGLGFSGEPGVNVLQLNLALDQVK